jgi:hypothetical protein
VLRACCNNSLLLLVFLVPGEGFEPPACGLQNRCSTTELTRQINDLALAYSTNWHRIGTGRKDAPHQLCRQAVHDHGAHVID